AALNAAYTLFDPRPGASFDRSHSLTGGFNLAWRPRARLEARAYGARHLGFSVLDAGATFEDSRFGFGATAPLTWRLRAGLFTELGRTRKDRTEADARSGDSDLWALGATADVRLSEKVDLQIRVSREEIDSNDPSVARTLVRIQTGLAFGSATLP